MKILKKELIEVEDDEIRVFKELAILRSLNHPNIIKLYEFYQDDSYLYFIYEYQHNGNLLNLIKLYGKSISEYTSADIMRQLISFLAYCHSNKIINRDIRPENILLGDAVYKTINGKEKLTGAQAFLKQFEQ